MLFLLSVLNNNMHGQDEYFRKDRSIMQLYMAVEFFQYLESVTKYHLIYEAFLRKHGVKSWNEYIRSIFGLISMLNYKAGWIPADLRNDSDSLISFGILESSTESRTANLSHRIRDSNRSKAMTFRECTLSNYCHWIGLVVMRHIAWNHNCCESTIITSVYVEWKYSNTFIVFNHIMNPIFDKIQFVKVFLNFVTTTTFN